MIHTKPFTLFPGFLLIAAVSLGRASEPATLVANPVEQIRIPRIEQMQNLPDGFHVPDWKRIATGFADLAFDLDAQGQYLPLVWLDQSKINFPEEAFGMYVTVGDPVGRAKNRQRRLSHRQWQHRRGAGLEPDRHRHARLQRP